MFLLALAACGADKRVSAHEGGRKEAVLDSGYVLVHEYAERDARGDFLTGDRWLHDHVTDPDVEPGYDAFQLIVSYRIDTVSVTPDTSVYRVTYHLIGTVVHTGEAEGVLLVRVYPMDSLETAYKTVVGINGNRFLVSPQPSQRVLASQLLMDSRRRFVDSSEARYVRESALKEADALPRRGR